MLCSIYIYILYPHIIPTTYNIYCWWSPPQTIIFRRCSTNFPPFSPIFHRFSSPFLTQKTRSKPSNYASHILGHEGPGSLLSALKVGFFGHDGRFCHEHFWGSLFIYGLSMVYLWIWIITVFPCFPHDLGEWTNGEVALEGGRDGELTQGLTVSDQFYVRCVDIFTGIRNSSSLVIFVSLNLFEMTTNGGP